VEAWGFIWIMVILKIPLAVLLWIVWWSIRAKPDPAAGDDDGADDGGLGAKPVPPRPSGPRRRGPHGDPVPSPPSRTRRPGPRAPGRERPLP
jgi:hypothetical protein